MRRLEKEGDWDQDAQIKEGPNYSPEGHSPKNSCSRFTPEGLARLVSLLAIV